MNQITIEDKNNEEDDLLTSREVANKLRTTISTLCYMRKHKTGPDYVRFGRHFKYPAKKLLAYIKENTNI